MCIDCELANDGRTCELCMEADDKRKLLNAMSSEQLIEDIVDAIITHQHDLNEYDNCAIANALNAINKQMHKGLIFDNVDKHNIAWAMWGQEVADRMYEEVAA